MSRNYRRISARLELIENGEDIETSIDEIIYDVDDSMLFPTERLELQMRIVNYIRSTH